MADVGVQSTSAATPAFHAIPSDDLHAARKYGRIEGIYSFVIFFIGENLYTVATAKRSFEVDLIPEEIFVHIIGNTSSMVINTGRVFLLMNIIAIKINEATGVAFTVLINGVISVFINENLTVITESMMPRRIATSTPINILPSDCTVIIKKFGSLKRANVALMTLSGEGRINELFILNDANAHKPIQKKSEQNICSDFFSV